MKCDCTWNSSGTLGISAEAMASLPYWVQFVAHTPPAHIGILTLYLLSYYPLGVIVTYNYHKDLYLQKTCTYNGLLIGYLQFNCVHGVQFRGCTTVGRRARSRVKHPVQSANREHGMCVQIWNYFKLKNISELSQPQNETGGSRVEYSFT